MGAVDDQVQDDLADLGWVAAYRRKCFEMQVYRGNIAVFAFCYEKGFIDDLVDV